MRSQECRKHIQKTGKVCHLKDDTIKEVQKILDFCEDHSEISELSTDAAEVLMKIPDPMVQQKAISIVGNALNRKTPTGGTIKKRLTKPEVEKAIKKISPPKTVKKESCDVKPSVPKKEPYNATPQKGDFQTDEPAPPPVRVAALMKEKYGGHEQPAPVKEVLTTPKPPCQINQLCPAGKDCLIKQPVLGNKCDQTGRLIRDMNECPIEKRERLAKEQNFVPASDIDSITGGKFVKSPPIRIVKAPESITFTPSTKQWDFIQRIIKSGECETPADVVSAALDSAMLQEGGA